MSKKIKVGIIDYGLGNLFSVERAVRHVGADPIITADCKILGSCQRFILPGVGAFGDGMKGLEERGLVEFIKKTAKRGMPILGICLGMQLLMSESEEFGSHQGLNLIDGRVVRFAMPAPHSQPFKVPHVGWNCLSFNQKYLNAGNIQNNLEKVFLTRFANSEVFMYFVHSYIVVPKEARYILATTAYGNDIFCSIVLKDRTMGCQFHPEKSAETGLSIFKKFLFTDF